jgi:hypothetical protein
VEYDYWHTWVCSGRSATGNSCGWCGGGGGGLQAGRSAVGIWTGQRDRPVFVNVLECRGWEAGVLTAGGCLRCVSTRVQCVTARERCEQHV